MDFRFQASDTVSTRCCPIRPLTASVWKRRSPRLKRTSRQAFDYATPSPPSRSAAIPTSPAAAVTTQGPGSARCAGRRRALDFPGEIPQQTEHQGQIAPLQHEGARLDPGRPPATCNAYAASITRPTCWPSGQARRQTIPTHRRRSSATSASTATSSGAAPDHGRAADRFDFISPRM